MTLERRLKRLESATPARHEDAEAIRRRIIKRLEGIRERVKGSANASVVYDRSPAERFVMGELDLQVWLDAQRLPPTG